MQRPDQWPRQRPRHRDNERLIWPSLITGFIKIINLAAILVTVWHIDTAEVVSLETVSSSLCSRRLLLLVVYETRCPVLPICAFRQHAVQPCWFQNIPRLRTEASNCSNWIPFEGEARWPTDTFRDTGHWLNSASSEPWTVFIGIEVLVLLILGHLQAGHKVCWWFGDGREWLLSKPSAPLEYGICDVGRETGYEDR